MESDKNEKRLKRLESLFPTLNYITVNSITESVLIGLDPVEASIYSLLKRSIGWEEHYTIIESVEDDEVFYWIKELKGIKFSTFDEARLYCFLNYCRYESAQMKHKLNIE